MDGTPAAGRGYSPLSGRRDLFFRLELAQAGRCGKIFPRHRRFSALYRAFPCRGAPEYPASRFTGLARLLHVYRHVLGRIRTDFPKRSNRTGFVSGLGRQHASPSPAPAHGLPVEFMGDSDRCRRPAPLRAGYLRRLSLPPSARAGCQCGSLLHRPPSASPVAAQRESELMAGPAADAVDNTGKPPFLPSRLLRIWLSSPSTAPDRACGACRYFGSGPAQASCPRPV